MEMKEIEIDKVIKLVIDKQLEPHSSIKLSRHGKKPQLYYNFEVKVYNDDMVKAMGEMRQIRNAFVAHIDEWEKKENSDIN